MLGDEDFDDEEQVAIDGQDVPVADKLPRRVPAWPKGHTPANACERDLWESFEDLRIDPATKLTQQIVAERIGRSRTTVSMGGDGYKLLRDAIQDEVKLRKALRKSPAATKPKKSKEQREAEKAARRETSIRYYQDIARRADALVMELEIRTIRAEDERDRLKARLQTIFADFKAGKWKRAGGGEDIVAELEAFLSVPGYGAAAPGAEVTPPQVAALGGKAARALPAWRDGRSTWRTRGAQ